MNSQELENRLVDFSVLVSEICASLHQNELGKNLSNQLTRSSSSSALNYGESRGAESRKDFIHKLRIVLKELRESHIALKILLRTNSFKNREVLDIAEEECNQLISIFVTTIRTAENNNSKKS